MGGRGFLWHQAQHFVSYAVSIIYTVYGLHLYFAFYQEESRKLVNVWGLFTPIKETRLNIARQSCRIYYRVRTLYSLNNVGLTFSLPMHPNPTTQQRHISLGTAQWEGQTVVSKLIYPVATTYFTEHYLMCAFQKAIDLLFDHCCFKRKLFSLCGIGGLSLLLGSQYNYQRLQVALLPGMEGFSQGYYYFHTQLFGSQTQHFNNLVCEAFDSKMNLGSISTPY